MNGFRIALEKDCLKTFKTYTEKVWGMSCDNISADWAAQRIKGLNLTNLILNSIQFLNFKKIKI